jgi:hypothetical protein
MGHYPEAAIFRRLGALNMLSLLSLQAELANLQVQLRDLWAEDEASHEDSERMFSTYFRAVRNSGNSLQYEMLLNIRQKLQEYGVCFPCTIVC